MRLDHLLSKEPSIIRSSGWVVMSVARTCVSGPAGSGLWNIDRISSLFLGVVSTAGSFGLVWKVGVWGWGWFEHVVGF